MKQVILTIALIVLTCTWASAESSVWKTQKGTSVMYLGGTFHILRDSDFPLPPEFDKAYKASDIVVFETDIAQLQDPMTQLKFMAKGIYADGSTIDKHLSPKTYGELSAFCKSSGIPLQSFSQFKPSMLMTTLTVLELMRLGANQQGVDLFYQGQANKDKKTVEGLENVDEQIDYIVSMADGDEDEFVTYSLKDLKTIRKQFETLAAAWRTGDADKLDKLMSADLKTQQPKLYKKLITDRNRNWLPLIDAYQKTPHTRFILVGAAHLVGPDGIIESLKKKGYKVEKL
jgi:uncharacterized protein